MLRNHGAADEPCQLLNGFGAAECFYVGDGFIVAELLGDAVMCIGHGGDLGQMLPAAAAMGLLLFSLRFFSAWWFGSLGWAGSAIMLALLVAIGAGLYAFFIAGFKAYDRRRHASR